MLTGNDTQVLIERVRQQHFGPIVATCLDLGVTPRFIPLREPWRNGVVEHFNDTWDKSFFRTEVFASLEHLRVENREFIAFHNEHHRYSAHGGTTPDQIWKDGSATRCRALTSHRPGFPPEDVSRSSASSDRTAGSICSENASS